MKKRRKRLNEEEDPAYPERYPHRFIPMKCAVCNKCWFDKEYDQCLYGGPFSGYREMS